MLNRFSVAMLSVCIAATCLAQNCPQCPTCPDVVAPLCPDCPSVTYPDCPGSQCQPAPIAQTPPPIVSLPAIMGPCDNGQCVVDVPCQTFTLELSPLDGDDASIDLTAPTISEATSAGDRFDQVIRATVRVTVRGSCGSGTVVGRDADGRALILTNAHVAGTRKGTVSNVQRWDIDGTSEKGSASIVASGYGRGMSVDFALLRANEGFASDVAPIPLADRYPKTSAGVTTFGCPRCEWPSLQVLNMRRNEGQVLRWHPQAIGGRSGSSLVDYADGSPKVVGLLTWGGGGEGLGQSTPFLLSAMRGRMPKSFEALPDNVIELCTPIYPAICQINGDPIEDLEPVGFLDDITDDESAPPPAPNPDQPAEPDCPDAPNVDKPGADDESGLIGRIIDRPGRYNGGGNDDDGCGILRPRKPGVFERVGDFVASIALLIFGGVIGFVWGRVGK